MQKDVPMLVGKVETRTELGRLLFKRTKRRRLKEGAIHGILLLCGLVSVLTTISIVIFLFTETVGFFQEVPIIEFLTGTRWTPLFTPKHFGILPLVGGTLLVIAGASLVALPIGLASATYLSEYAPDGVRRLLKPLLEILAGIPTVVYGYFALTFVTPLLRRYLFPDMSVFNALSASLVIGTMILPMVASLSEDAMMSVSRSLREAAYALGATRFEVTTRVVLPAALSGISASFILAISRAIGEAMIVSMAAGATPKLTINPLESIQALTAYIVQVSGGDTPRGTLEYQSIFAVGTTLFVMTLIMNTLGQLVVRYRERY
ncbi:phosphate transport system permease protein [Candidatus Hakubella thermalkaliphila]|uniref:Phosphate transport system permease protein n=2 Tax=Candidatus Hakubella thermalkaliphila TaxID=2754717 RepID=A0A6V8PQ39_9ACTN|nr:phosphate ABC transporter permease subunit PstC [Candidatus Hakubella thermalkaliphila]MBT9170249.1 Phosphate transport system permease protein PstC 1 [Actinomycetota bacterium]GFP27158.1 phosphate transport system permease protein [Candidatus Hakubella thermalkaliphila]GFP34347.1 phosphate transport system permease protein [Candidatus Hakubella thermalkaliphila]